MKRGITILMVVLLSAFLMGGIEIQFKTAEASGSGGDGSGYWRIPAMVWCTSTVFGCPAPGGGTCAHIHEGSKNGCLRTVVFKYCNEEPGCPNAPCPGCLP